MPSIGLIIVILLLICRAKCLNDWIVHPTETLQKNINGWRMLHKIFFFVPFLVPYGFYERNPEYAISTAIKSEIIGVILITIFCILAIISMFAGK